MTPADGDPPRHNLEDLTASLPSVVLLSRLKDGNEAARDELIRRYWPRLERWARGRLPAGARDLYDTADLVQETMMKALGRLHEFDPRFEGALPAYFRAAILNRIRTLAVRSRRRGEATVLESGLPDARPSPLEEAVGSEVVDRYEKALARLRPDDRRAIQLRVELCLPYDEVARELEKPSASAARMAVSRALYRLAAEMGRHG
jgi:RNA polymerase sigma factor (sigma-70 family)